MVWFESICRVIHVLAAVCWIGGLYILIRVVRPVLLNNGQPGNQDTLIRTIQKKFLVLAGMMLLTVLISGLGNLFIVVHKFSGVTPPMTWMILLTIKLLLALGLFGIYAINYYSMKNQPPDRMVKPRLVFPKTALIFGLIIITIGVILHTPLAY